MLVSAPGAAGCASRASLEPEPEEDVTFRLCVLNPNSDASVTEHLRARATSVLPAGSEVEVITCPSGPAVIETAAESAAAAEWLVESAISVPADAYFIGCFGNPGAATLRQETSAIVVGLGEAALTHAVLATRRFGLLTTLELGVPGLSDQVAAATPPGACVGIAAVNSEAGMENDDLIGRLVRRGSDLLGLGADGLVLACATFSPHSERLAAALGVIVCDGASLGPSLAHSLWAAAPFSEPRVSGRSASRADRA
jgi:allantoin racemase